MRGKKEKGTMRKEIKRLKEEDMLSLWKKWTFMLTTKTIIITGVMMSAEGAMSYLVF